MMWRKGYLLGASLMTFLAGRIKAVFDKMKYLWNRISQRIEGNLAKSEEIADFQDLERTRKKLVQMRFRNEGSEASGAYAMDAVRRRMTGEFGDVEALAGRVKSRQAVNKWFHREDLTESGSFNAVDFDKRLKEVYYESEERPLEPLPAVEDTFMAFSKSEDNLFDEEPISLSGVHYRVDPLEDFDETYSTPALPMFGAAREEIDFTPVTSFSPETDGEVEQSSADKEITSSNPMLQVLNDLEERMAINNQRRDAYWVGD